MSPTEAKEALGFILGRIKAESFVPEYKATDEEALGLLVSKFFEWDGVRIMRAAFSALEDANFHTEAALVERMAEEASR